MILRKLKYRGFEAKIHFNEGIFTATIHDPRAGMMPMTWSLNTFRPETVADAVKAVRHIIDNPTKWSEGT